MSESVPLLPSSLNDCYSASFAAASSRRKATQGKAAATASVSAVRALVTELRQIGIEDPAELLREGTVAMGHACLAAYRRRSDVSTGWLVAALRSGGGWSAVQRELPGGYEHEQTRRERAGALRDQLASMGLSL